MACGPQVYKQLFRPVLPSVLVNHFLHLAKHFRSKPFQLRCLVTIQAYIMIMFDYHKHQT